MSVEILKSCKNWEKRISQKEYLDWTKIDCYNATINVVQGTGGIGKTFGKVMSVLRKCIQKGKEMMYIVRTEIDVKALVRNNGNAFLESILEELEKSNRNTDKWFYEKIKTMVAETSVFDDEGNEKVIREKKGVKVLGQDLMLNGQILVKFRALTQADNVKKTNHPRLRYVIWDEAIPLNIDKSYSQEIDNFISIMGTCLRTKNVKIWIISNAIRANDLLLEKLNILNLENGEIRVLKYKNFRLLAVSINPNQYPKYLEKLENSTLGGLLGFFGGDKRHSNEYNLTKLPQLPSHIKTVRICNIHGEYELQINEIRHNTTEYMGFYIARSTTKSVNGHYCINKKFAKNGVKYNEFIKELLTKRQLWFESEYIYQCFKVMTGLEAI